jgi:RimJ/RimL family protein N-acetyltransferase
MVIAMRTDRLILRDWREADQQPWAAMNADPEVRRYLGPPLTAGQAEAWTLNYQDDLDRHGYGFWALEVQATGEFIGFAGLDRVDEEMPFTGIELGWRLARPAWGNGYATEAGHAALRYAFDELEVAAVVAVTAAINLRSQAVMRRLGMTTDAAEDFHDPDIDDDQLRRQVVYRVHKGQ